LAEASEEFEPDYLLLMDEDERSSTQHTRCYVEAFVLALPTSESGVPSVDEIRSCRRASVNMKGSARSQDFARIINP